MDPFGKPRKRKDGESPDAAGAPAVDVLDAETAPRKAIVCGGCGHVVSSSDRRTEVDGRHRHTCVNPAGFVFHIGCFSEAPGCVGEGGWTDYFSWFAGTMWQISLCGHCGMHLGWAFSGQERPDFHGLILDRIEEQDEGDGAG